MDSLPEQRMPITWHQPSLFESPEKQDTVMETDTQSVRVPKWFLTVVGFFALGMVTWMSHLTIQVNEVQRAQVRGEYLFESHDELREDVRNQSKALADMRNILTRIEAKLQ